MNRIILGAALVLATGYDNRENRIPNLLCAVSVGTGLVYFLLSRGLDGAIEHCIWAAGLGICFFPLWLGRVAGGGDIKLLITAGFLLAEDSVPLLMCAGVCLGIHAILLMMIRGNYYQRMALFVRYVMDCVESRMLKPYPFNKEEDSKEGGIRMSYSFLAGHLLALLMKLYH